MLRSVCTLTLCKSLRSGVICPVIGGLFAHDLWSNSFVMSVLFVHRRSVGLVCTSTPEVQLGRQSAVEDTSEIVGLVWALSRYSRHQACKLRRLGVVSIGGNIVDIQRGVRNGAACTHYGLERPDLCGHDFRPIVSTRRAVS